jgi:hypothetical protein
VQLLPYRELLLMSSNTSISRNSVGRSSAGIQISAEFKISRAEPSYMLRNTSGDVILRNFDVISSFLKRLGNIAKRLGKKTHARFGKTFDEIKAFSYLCLFYTYMEIRVS